MDEKSSASQRLIQNIQALRYRISAEKALYCEMKPLLENNHPKAWSIVANTLKTIAIYYSGEITRAKNDTADWMRGLKVSGGYADNETVDAAHEFVDDIKKIATANESPENTTAYINFASDLLVGLTKNIEDSWYAKK